jgi:hypothetical protein
MLSAFVLAPDGRKVKCSSCGETWFQLPDPEELREDFEKKPDEIPASIRPLPRGSGLPVVKDKEREEKSGTVGGAIAAAILFVAVTAIFVFMHDPIVRAWPPAHKVYALIGISPQIPGEGLVFDKLDANSGEGSVTVNGTIINLTRETVPVPMMQVILQDGSGAALSNAFIEPPQKSVAPEAVLPFTASFPDAEGAVQINIRFTLQKP